MSGKFTYKTDPKLAEAKARLRDLQAQRETRAQSLQLLRSRVVEARDARDVLELRAGFERVPAASLAAARSAYDAALAELQAAEHQPDSPAPFAYLANLIEQLEAAEQRENMAALRPIYGDGLRRLDAALSQAAAIADELAQLRAASGPLALGLPAAWADELVTGGRMLGAESRLARWRDEMAATGWPTR